MRGISTLVFVLLLCTFSTINAQNCDPLSPPNVAAAGCGCAFPDCNVGLSGFTGILGTQISGSTNIPECTNGAGGVFNNDAWIAFIAGSSSINITITPSNCDVTPGGQSGVQAGFYDSCTSGGGTDEGIPSGGLFVQCNCSTAPVTLNYDQFVCGQTYYIFVDGCAGSICDYTITVNSGSTTLNPPGPLNAVMGPTTVCDGAMVTYSVDEVFCVPDYDWTITGSGSIVSQSGNTVTVQWTSPGGSISAMGSNSCYSTNATLPYMVNVMPLQPIMATGEYCDDEPGYTFPINGLPYTEGTWNIDVPITSGPDAGCSQPYILTVTRNPTYNINIDRTICFGEQVIYGGLPYSSAGPYTIDLQTVNTNCDSVINLNLTVLDPVAFVSLPPAPLDEISCTNPTVIIDGSQSFPAQDIENYDWTSPNGGIIENGQGTPVITVSTGGTFCLTVAYGAIDGVSGQPVYCPSMQSCVDVAENLDPPTLGVSSTPVNCPGANDGTATVSISGGQGPFLIAWTDGPPSSTTETATGLSGGTYTVSVFSITNGCTASETVTVLESTGMTLDMSSEDSGCAGATTGTASVVVNGGVPMFDYVWNTVPVQNGPTATNLMAGTYTVTVTDASNCTAENSVIVGQGTEVMVTIDGVNILCNGENTGEATANGTGGTGVYTYEWNGDPSLNTQTITGLTAGPYTVVISDENNCTATENITITESPAMTTSIIGTDPGCSNSTDGEATVTVGGGMPNYTYAWSNTSPVQTGATATGLGANIYVVTVTDENNCSVTETITLVAPNALTLSSSQVDILCTGESTGTATLIPTGGTDPLSYSWNDAAAQNTPTAVGLPAGDVTGTVTDANGCTETITVTLTEPALALEVTGVSTDALCGDNNGTIDLTVVGGVDPYSFDWGTSPIGNVEDPGGLGAGSYTVVVTDENDCTATVTVTVNSPNSPSAMVEITAVTCNGLTDGIMDVTPTGGTVGPGGYTFVWSPASNNGNEDLSGVGAGSYSVTISDDVGCTVVANGVIPEPDELDATATASPADCGIDNGSISTVVSGGTFPYTFDWPGTANDGDQSPTDLAAGSYEVTITDDNGCSILADAEVIIPNGPTTTISGTDVGCNGDETGTVDIVITGGATPYDIDWGDPNLNGLDDLNDLPAGTYAVVVTDDNNCSSVAQIDIIEPDALVIDVSSTPVNCFGGSDGTATVVVTGGDGQYTYEWCDGQTGSTAIGCPPGDCEVVVTDGNNCIIVATVTVDEPTEMQVSAVPTDVDCNGASTGGIEVTASGGIAGYNYTWTGGIPADTEDPGSLQAGTYDLIVTDANGCTMEITDIVINEPDALQASATPSPTDCGSDNGSISTIVSGGTGSYFYDWPGTANDGDQNPINLAEGSYEVTISDDNGCIILADATVITPAGPSMTISGTDVGCNDDETGTVSIIITGGTLPYDIDWGNPNYNGLEDLTDLPAGTYAVVVTDDNNCTSEAQIDVLEPTPLVIDATSTPVSCFGATDGTATVNIIGGTAPYDILWCDSQTTPVALDCPAGSCTVIVTDANGCIAQTIVVVEEPTAISASAVATDADCNAANTGSIELTVSGGTGAYDFTWTSGIPNMEDPGSLLAGLYDVIVSDANGCTMEITGIEITEPEPMGLTFTTVDATCNENNGSIDISVTGGTVPYVYNWTGGPGVIEDPTGVGTGNYDVVITDDNGCSIMQSIFVSTPDPLVISSVASDADCNGASTGSIEVTLSGGVTPYTYLWDDADAQIVEDATDLAAGVYVLTVTDANDCTITTTATINEPTAIVLSATSTDATCNTSNGTIDLTVTGGTGDYSYSWTGGPGDVQDPIDLSSGTYDVTVSDENGCTAVLSQPVNTPSGLSSTVSVVDANCFGENNGSIDLNVIGGLAPYTYLWDDADAQITEDLASLAAGVYNVVITDDDGCTIVASGTVNQPDLLEATGTSEQASCNQANGSINLTVDGGVEPYDFVWTGTTQIIEDPVNLPSGSYDVMITDAQGCIANANVIVTEPDPLVLSTVTSDALCNGDPSGAIDLGVIGGTGPGTYTYQWDDADGQIVEDAVALMAGVYTVIVTDANDCTLSTTAEIFEPALIDANGTSSDATCNESNGSIDLTVSGGTMPYVFAWSGVADPIEDPQNLPAGSYNVTITDINGCTFTTTVPVNTPSELFAAAASTDALCNGEASGSIDLTITGGTAPYDVEWNGGLGMVEDPVNVPQGDYFATITDADGCQIFTAASVNEPTIIEGNSTSVDATCNESNGSIDLTISGGTAPYTFVWDGGADPVEDPNGLTTGNYNVTVTDDNSCTMVFQAEVNTPGTATISTTSQDVSCNGDADGSIDLLVVGGISPFTFNWSNGGDTEDLNGLPAAMYTVTITDGNDCTITTTVNINEPDPLEAADQLPTEVSCNGGNNGSALIVPTGGTAPYSFDWNNNAFDGQDAPSNMSSGFYIVTVTDGNGCTVVVDDIEITEPPAITLSANSVSTLCFGTSDGTIDLTVGGGTAPYSFDWNNGAFADEDPQGVSAGNYTVVVTDNNGCTQTTNVQVDQPTAVLLNIVNVSNYGGTNVTCSDATDGSAEAAAVGGTGPYSYAWSTGAVTPQVEDLGAGVYQVIATDANGCSTENEVPIIAPTPVQMALQVTPPSCYGENDAVIFAEGEQGTGPYMYSLDGEVFSGVNVFGGLTSGAYDIIVQDINGCEQEAETTVIDPAELTIDLGDDIEIQLGDSTQLEPIGSIPFFAFDTLIWSRGLVGLEPWVTPLQTTNYQITIADSTGCTATDEIVVRVNKDRLIYIPNAFTPNDDGFNEMFQIYAGTGVLRISSFRVFNRWGEIVHEAENFTPDEAGMFAWNGKFRGELLNPAVFVYLAEIEFVDGRVELYKGDVTLMR